MKQLLLAFCVFLFLSHRSWSQDAGGESDGILQESISDVYTVVGCSAGGAILGLSTLSFAEDPWSEGKNIVVGASIGLILGVAIVAWSQASKSQRMYQDSFDRPQSSFKKDTNWKVAWHYDQHKVINSNSSSLEGVTLNFRF